MRSVRVGSTNYAGREKVCIRKVFGLLLSLIVGLDIGLG